MTSRARNVALGTLLSIGAIVAGVAGVMYYNTSARTSQQPVRSGTADVRAFGAVGDGITDDTKAVQAAIDSTAAAVIIGDQLTEAVTPYDAATTRKVQAAGRIELATAALPVTSSMAPAFLHRRAIVYVVTGNLDKLRFNVDLLPNLHEGPHPCDGEWIGGVAPQHWNDEVFLRSQGADVRARLFPVRIQRERKGAVTLIETKMVPLGPRPPHARFVLKAADWKMGDKVRIPIDSELIMVTCDGNGAVIVPSMNRTEPSGDSTAVPGKVIRW